jgi:hypothetical protein
MQIKLLVKYKVVNCILQDSPKLEGDFLDVYFVNH